ncbi:MAG: hypothetical protein M3Z14_05190 [Candidatus Eremiobacteraeota bacterium]|nr:hypothetical protein [Candidatus Eremiobacteraeota bacterium]
MAVFSYLSVLISILIGLGMSHLLGAMVRLIHNRSRTKFYWPSQLWAINLFLLLTLIWWADFNLNRHEYWTFAIFLATLTLPAILYVACGLVLPASEVRNDDDMRAAYFENRVWFLSLISTAIALSFVQTYLLDGHITVDTDAGLKVLLLSFSIFPIVSKAEIAQKTAALANFATVVFYIVFLFYNLRY